MQEPLSVINIVGSSWELANHAMKHVIKKTAGVTFTKCLKTSINTWCRTRQQNVLYFKKEEKTEVYLPI